MRLIDAYALKAEVNKKKVVGRFNTIMLIDNAPTVDERQKGEWIYLDKDEPMKVECPFCHERKCCISNYCDYCGADMRGDNNDNN